MAINRLAQSNPDANTDTLLHTSERNAVVSIIATNTSSSAADVTMWTVPNGAGSAEYIYHAANTALPGNNTLETFRFAIEDNDQLYVRSSTAFVSFSLNGIYESNGTSNITVASLSASPTSNTLGDVWVNSDDDTVNFWDGSTWITAGGASDDSALTAHESDTTNVHGIADTSALVLTNDARLTDSRTPTAHAASHASGGSDAITVAQSQVTDLTTDLAGKVGSNGSITQVIKLTQAEYNAITPNATTLYVIVG